jgi:hypothetical protein
LRLRSDSLQFQGDKTPPITCEAMPVSFCAAPRFPHEIFGLDIMY